MISIFPLWTFQQHLHMKYISLIWSYIPEHVEIIASKVVRSPPWLCWPLRNICITNDHGYVPLDVSTSRSFPRWRLITVFVTGVTRQVPLVVQELIILPEHLGSTLVFSGVRFARSLVFCVLFCRSLFIVLSFWILLYMYMYLLSI
jgi:hypothetical protein